MTAQVGVYVMVDRYDRPLYVGASRDMERRVREHESKPWWSRVASIEKYPQADWELALYVERNLISHLSPEFNIQSADPDERFHNAIRGALLESVEAI